MSFLKQLRAIWDGFWHKKDDLNNTKQLSSEHPLARYLLTPRYFSVGEQRVKWNAFLPPPSKALSVFRIDGLSEADIWKIGRTHVSDPQGKTLYARGDILVSSVQQSDLQVLGDDQPPRHAEIVGWPDDKSAQKLMAKELAAQATLALNNED